MKYVLALCLLVLPVMAYADEVTVPQQTVNTDVTVVTVGPVTQWSSGPVIIPEQKITIPEQRNAVGAGTDIVVWESPKKEVAAEVQYKYDFENKNHQAYLVAKINLWEAITKK